MTCLATGADALPDLPLEYPYAIYALAPRGSGYGSEVVAVVVR